MKKLIPETIENKIPSNKFVYYFTWLLVAFNFFRSLEHIFNEDGGAQSIAGIPLDYYIPEASNNIISIFAQWGFSQLVLACILLLVVLKMRELIPETIENKIPSNKFVYYFTWLLVAFNFFRSLEHIFNEDGGAQSIAGIPLDFYIPEASNNIISIFAQWGFSQLVLACILLLVVLKIREFIPLMLLIIALENILRGAVGLYKPLILGDAPPGAVSPIIGLVTLVVFFISIRENK